MIGNNVRVDAAAVAHGGLVVTISESPIASQPNALAGGNTQLIENSNIQIEKPNNRLFYFKGGATLKDLVNAVNAVGAAPGDLMAIP